jgi:vitamin B12 transporter
MNKQLKVVGVAAMLLASSTIFSQEKKEKEIQLDEVVISATKFKLEKEKVGKVITKITQKEIQNNAGKTVVELLNNVTGIELNGANSNRGNVVGTYIRGGRSRQVVVLIDGIPVSDPTGINQEYDLRLLSLNQIESIEVLKGASSTLYGSGAATGVINIILKKSSKKAVAMTYEVSLGTNTNATDSSLKLQDRNQNVNVNGSLGQFSYLASFNISGVDGLSSAKSNTVADFEHDAFYKESGMLKLGYQFTETFKLNGFVNYEDFDSEFDAGAYNDDSRNTWNYSQVRYGIRPSFTYDKGEVYAIASFNKVDRFLTQFNSYSKSIYNIDYTGKSINIDVVNRYAFNDNYQLITGVNYQDHSNSTVSPFGNISKDLANFNTLDPYASLVYNSDYGLNVNLGGRLNHHSNYGSHFVYDANLSYNFNIDTFNLKALTSYSTAFIAPSTYQLFSGSYGNLDLNPESSGTFEFGIEISDNKFIQLDAVYFNRSVDDAIIFVSLPVAPWTSSYENATGNTKVSGIESNVTITPLDNLKLQVGYTSITKDTNADYIPKNKIVANVEVSPFDNTFVSLVYKNVGERTYFDKWGSFGTAGNDVILPSYNLLDINANYKLLDENVTFFATVSNLFNEDYEETLGYDTRGRNVKAGIRLQF